MKKLLFALMPFVSEVKYAVMAGWKPAVRNSGGAGWKPAVLNSVGAGRMPAVRNSGEADWKPAVRIAGILPALFISLAVVTQAQELVKVTGERVSLRAAPESNAVLLSRTMTGDELVLKDNSLPDWVGVQPPETIDLWVNSEFVSSNTVLPELLNIRSGPSLSHTTVGTAHKGDSLIVRGEMAQWLRIAPTSNTVVWISRKYVQGPSCPVVEPVKETQTVTQVNGLFVEEVAGAVSESALKKLKMDPAKKQGDSAIYSGVLQPADDMLYKLADNHFTDIIVCYVFGNKPQMQTFSGIKIEITGKTYWVEGKDLPVVIPSRIRLLPVKAVK